MEQYPDDFNPYAAPSEAPAHPVEVFGSQKTLDKVASGFNLVFWGMIFGIILVVLVVVLTAGAFGAGARGDFIGLQNAQILALFVLFVWMIYVVLDLVGKCLCLAVPREARARELIVGSVTALCIWLGLFVLNQFVLYNFQLRILALIISPLSTMLFILFIKRIAEFMTRRDLMDRAQTLLVLWIILYVCAGGILTMQFFDLAGSAGLILLMGLTVLILLLVFCGAVPASACRRPQGHLGNLLAIG